MDLSKPPEGYDGYSGYKDATHVACVWTRSDEPLSPGQWVKFRDDHLNKVFPTDEDPHGVVNPFLKDAEPMSEFWVLLFPGVATEVRHDFDICPEVDDQLHHNWCKDSCAHDE